MNDYLKKYAIPIAEANKYSTAHIGNKAYNLSLLEKKQDGYCVPPGYIITDKIVPISKEKTLSDILDLISYPIIIRSSCNLEDSNYSFAGLFSSIICYDQKQMLTSLHSVFSSLNTDEVKAYCKRFGIEYSALNMSAIIQKYLEPETSGVVFTSHPVKNDTDIVYIEYSDASSDAITAGITVPKTVEINKNQPSELFDKYPLYVKLIYQLALRLEIEWGYPIDVEWLWKDNIIWLIQIRKITVR